MINNRKEFYNAIDMLKGNINRISVTDDIYEVADMYLFASHRLKALTLYRIKELSGKSKS